MKLIPILFIIAGVVLVYAARTDKDPRNVIFEALGSKMRVENPAPVGGYGKSVGTWVQPSTGTGSNPPGTVVTTV